MLDQKRVGEFIAKLRKDRELTQAALADMLCVSHQAVSKWENGAAMPDLEVLFEMRKIFGVSIDDILDGVPPPDTSDSKLVRQSSKAEPEGEADVITDDSIIVYTSREFTSPVKVNECRIYGEAHFMADLVSDVVQIDTCGHGKFDGAITCDSLAVAGHAQVYKQVTADSVGVTGCLTSGAGMTCDSLGVPGSASLGGGLICDSLQVAGTLKLGGGAICDSLAIPGEMTVGGGVTTDSLDNMGWIHIGGGLQTDSTTNLGSATIGGGVSADEFTSRGELSIGGGLTGDSVDLSGRFSIGGGIAAGEVRVILSESRCDCDSVMCESLTVKTDRARPNAVLSARDVTAGSVDAVNLHSDRVKARSGRIGAGCKIARLESGPELEVSPDAEIGERVSLQ